VTAGERYPARTRILHWLTAILVFAALLIGFAMVNSLGSYAALIGIHMTIGLSILVIVVVRAANRFHAPHPGTAGVRREGRAPRGRRLGAVDVWPTSGAAARRLGDGIGGRHLPRPVSAGVTLPRIAPFDANLYFVLRQMHTVLAFLLVAVIAAHVSAVLLHTLSLRDGMLSRMTFRKALTQR